MFKGKVVTIDEMLKKSGEVKKSNNAPKLTKDESREWLNLRIRNKAKSACRYLGKKPSTLASITNEAYENLVDEWAYNKMILEACRAVKLDREYISSLISDLFDSEGKPIVPKDEGETGLQSKTESMQPVMASMVSIDEEYESLEKARKRTPSSLERGFGKGKKKKSKGKC